MKKIIQSIGRKKVVLAKTDGFTIIELITVVAIFAVVTTVVMVRFSSFNNRILTTNLAYDIALSIRQAQTFGVNVRGFDTGDSVTFDVGYGVHFNTSSDNSYTFFADLNGNQRFDNGEAIDVFIMGGGHVIKKFCGTTPGPNTICSDDTPSFNDLDILFERPNPDAIITRPNPPTTFQSGSITITSLADVDRQVQIYSTGQIAIVDNP